MTFSDHTAMTAGRSDLGRFGAPQGLASIILLPAFIYDTI
jgi:hypothetical protein